MTLLLWSNSINGRTLNYIPDLGLVTRCAHVGSPCFAVSTHKSFSLTVRDTLTREGVGGGE